MDQERNYYMRVKKYLGVGTNALVLAVLSLSVNKHKGKGLKELSYPSEAVIKQV